MRICRAATDEVVASEVRWARSAPERVKGLIGTSPLPEESALILAPARQIHTFGMGFSIDAVFCDREWQVLHVIRSMPPRRVSRVVWRARYAIELRGGTLPPTVVVGERLRLVSSPMERRPDR